ncbi:cytochrome P450 CYP82D47-like [Quercus robur]|uniref:cytochrome P450 CYP82D47-like n=1 Tax=Quercus robur TaxID=38942 RepID=UPI0021610D2E|nr:cytochrome P450 CYP82D47-like [Quercus robur]XP_050252814.1 cytochrome P450 CYP82D47-like [Quercus robur]XP_050252815.1 cytochrome P450 CYP82D47-like [Quercus robur]
MEITSHLLAIAGFFVLALLYNQWRVRIGSRKIKGMLAPEPSGALPIIGHLHKLRGQNPIARTLGAMADKDGPIFMIRLGMKPALVISSHEAVKECFTTNDKAFAARPMSSQGKHLGYNYAVFGFSSYGKYWHMMRKLTKLELLSSRRLETLKNVQVFEVETVIKDLYTLCKSNEGNQANVVISEWVERLTFNIITKMIAGKRYFDSFNHGNDEEAQRIGKNIKAFMYAAGVPIISDLIPFLGCFDLLGQVKSMKRIARELDSVAGSWVEEHSMRRLKGSEPTDKPDFIDVMLSEIEDDAFGHTRETIIKATAMNLILAGSDTTSLNLTWLLSILLNNKHALKQAQEELNLKVGRDRWVDDHDIKDLVYLQAIVKETLRLYPPSPLSVPHEAMEDCHVCGYYVPKGTRLLVNVWKLHRDPRIWEDPEKFLPERFLTSHASIDASGQHFEFIPFGSGRRACPGYTFALQVSYLALARLLQGFEFMTPSNMLVDMTEGLGITLPKATPLEVLLTPRLASKLYQSQTKI